MKLIKFQVKTAKTAPATNIGPAFDSFTDAYNRWQYEYQTSNEIDREALFIEDVPVEVDMAGF